MTVIPSPKPLALAAVAASFSALSLTLAMPMAHADPLDPIINTVKGDRGKFGPRCQPYTYNGDLEASAQTYARSENPADGQGGNYNGQKLAFLGSGDPQSAATTDAYKRGAGNMLSNCEYTEFGVGFVRHEDRSVDVVTIVFGKPNAAPKPADIPVPAGSGQGPAVSPEPVKPEAPHDAIQVDIQKAGLNVKVNVTNTSDVAGKCAYTATPVGNVLLPTVNKNFNIGAKGSTQLTFLAPPPLSTYHVVVSCNGTFNGQNIVLGQVEQDVSG